MDHAHAAGSALSLLWDGQLYLFSELTDKVKGDYVAWLKSRADAVPYEMLPNLKKPDGSNDLQRFAETKAHIVNSMSTMAFDWGGNLCSASLAGIPGQAKLLHLSHLQSGSPFADVDEIEALVICKHQVANDSGIDVEESEVAVFLKRLMEDSFPKSRAAFLQRKRKAAAVAETKSLVSRKSTES